MPKIVKRIVRKVGHSNYVAIPSEMCNLVGIQEGTVLNIEHNNDRITLTPIIEVP